MEWMLGAWVFCATERFCVLSSKQVSCPQSRVYASLKRVDDVIDLKVCAMCFCVVFVQVSWLQRRWNKELDGFVVQSSPDIYILWAFFLLAFPFSSLSVCATLSPMPTSSPALSLVSSPAISLTSPQFKECAVHII